MPAVLEATRRLVRPETPARLRLWVATTLLITFALLVSTSLVMARVQHQVRVIGDQAAPQAANAADLYFALSDLDAQVARLLLTTGRDELAGTRIDALGAYRERGRQVDTALQSALASGASPELVLRLLHGLGDYRERVWQALTAGPAATGYYTQATNILHLDLLPAATGLREASEQRLSQAYEAKRATQVTGVILAVVLGGALVTLLIGLQLWLARRFRRFLNPALLAATALTALLLIPLTAVLVAQDRALAEARDRSLVPFLELSRVRAVSYDAAADTSRYLISNGLDLYRTDFDRKAEFLGSGPFRSAEMTERWRAYQAGHDRIVKLADDGRRAEAIGALTGIGRGDAAFDFSYYDAAVAELTASRRDDFDRALRDVRLLLTGWPFAPTAVLGLVLLLVPLSVRKRFAEYR